MDFLMTEKTWELIELNKDKKVIHNKWVYRVEQETDGTKWYNVRLIVKGFQHKEGMDYNGIFFSSCKNNYHQIGFMYDCY